MSTMMASSSRSSAIAMSITRLAVRPNRFMGVGMPNVVRSTCRPYSRSMVAEASVKAGPAISQTNRAEITLRRFWKTVNIQTQDNGDYLITLDHRNLKTPGGAKLIIPKERRLLAVLIANEWENQDEVLKQHALPTTSLASRAIDGLSDPATREGVINALMEYLETDTIYFHSDKPRALVRMQDEHWRPLYDWVADEFGVKLRSTEGLVAPPQDKDTTAKLRQAIESMGHWELAAFERAVYATKSFIIALALCRGRLTADEAAQASHVEVRSQIETWGEVEDTHDVDHQDIRRALGSVTCLLIKA